MREREREREREAEADEKDEAETHGVHNTDRQVEIGERERFHLSTSRHGW